MCYASVMRGWGGGDGGGAVVPLYYRAHEDWVKKLEHVGASSACVFASLWCVRVLYVWLRLCPWAPAEDSNGVLCTSHTFALLRRLLLHAVGTRGHHTTNATTTNLSMACQRRVERNSD